MKPIRITRNNKLDRVETAKFWLTIKRHELAARARYYGPIVGERIDEFFVTQAGSRRAS